MTIAMAAAALLLHGLAAARVGVELPIPLPDGCYVDNATGPVTYVGGNIFPYPYSVVADNAGDCCQQCQSFKNCSFWTYTCVGKAGKCCYLKDSSPHSVDAGGAADMSGSTKPLPVPPKLKAFRFSTAYGSHMVLHQAPKTPVVWGYCGSAAACAAVKVTLKAGGTAARTVDAALGGEPGTWIAKLPATAGSDTPHTVSATDGTHTAALDDVLFGDVWVCSGQSNMAFLLENAYNGTALVKDADNHPTLRFFTSKKTSSAKPLLEQPQVEQVWSVGSANAATDDHFATNESCPTGGTPPPCKTSWQCPYCTPEAAGAADLEAEHEQVHTRDDAWLYMSAVCYIYGRAIQAHTGKPLGLVNTNWGGTPVEDWMSKEAEDACSSQRPPSGVGGAYNGMIKPLLNMTITGAVWYQGESNQGDPRDSVDSNGLPMVSYGCRFPAMIADWRTKWAVGSLGTTADDFPFGFVQLAPWYSNNAPAGVRWAQTAGYGHVPNLAMPNTFQAIAFDLTDYNSPFGSVHIRDKTTVGHRLALGGISQAYGTPGIYWQGPTIASAKASGGKITLTFNNTGAGGLEVKQAVSKLQNVTAWEVCVPSEADLKTTGVDACGLLDTNGDGKGWKPATVSSSTASTVTLSATSDPTSDLPTTQKKSGNVNVTSTAAGMLVRYGWAAIPFDYKKAGLYAKSEGLPAGPFVIKAE